VGEFEAAEGKAGFWIDLGQDRPCDTVQLYSNPALKVTRKSGSTPWLEVNRLVAYLELGGFLTGQISSTSRAISCVCEPFSGRTFQFPR
jgi:hypothetical protein